MKLNFSTLLVAIGFAISLFSCTDHRLGGDLSPARLRLKTVQSGTAITTYTYDNQNRLSTISKPDGSLGVIAYGDPDKKYVTTDAETQNTFYVNYPNPADQTQGTITRYPYTLDGTSFLAIKYYLVNSKISYSFRIRDYNYTFDASKHLTHVTDYYETGANDINGATYSYSGDNIATGNFSYAGGHVLDGPYSYTYDDKTNPFFGLLDPDVDNLLRFTRNNPLAKTPTGNYPTTTYEYEYNQQNLPIKSTAKVTVNNVPTVTTVLTYTYESY